jgi:drug/metabolite transporter (DMT)-like permease
VKGLVLMIVSTVAFSIMSALLKVASDISPFKTVFFRFAVGLGLLGLAALWGKVRLEFFRSRLLFMRGLVGGTAVFILFLSIVKLGVGKGTLFSYSYPVFACILSSLFLKERIRPMKWYFIVTAFMGIFLLAAGKSGANTLANSLGWYEILAVFGAVCSGIAIVMVKRLHDTDSSYAIFFSQCLIGFWLFVVPANMAEDAGGMSEGVLLLSIGVVAAIGQLLMTEAYRHITVTTGSLLNMLVPVFNFALAIAIFQEPFSILELAGAALVLLSCLLVISCDRFFPAVPSQTSRT